MSSRIGLQELSTNPDGDTLGNKNKFPSGIGNIIAYEFCERFCYYALRCILTVFLVYRLGYDHLHIVIIVYHVFITLRNIVPVFGRIFADYFLGRFKTIVCITIFYFIGYIMIIISVLPKFPIKYLAISGLFVIAWSTGCTKPNISMLAYDQFVMPEEAELLRQYFSFYYNAVYYGALLSQFVTPLLRSNIECNGQSTCYPIAFSVPAFIIFSSILILLSASKVYRKIPPTGNMGIQVLKCIGNALITRHRQIANQPREHWLDYSEERYSKQIIQDIKQILRVLVLFIPLPMFWSLADQVGSRWVMQAIQMNGNIGQITIKPDQMQVINPALIVIFTPTLPYIFYPILKKIGIQYRLERMTLGMSFAAVAFFISGCIQIKIDESHPKMPENNEHQLRVLNGLDCDYRFLGNISNGSTADVDKMIKSDLREITPITMSGNYIKYSLTPNIAISSISCPPISGELQLQSAATTLYFAINLKDNKPYVTSFDDTLYTKTNLNSFVRLLTTLNLPQDIIFYDFNKQFTKRYNSDYETTSLRDLPPGRYAILIGKKDLGIINLLPGCNYAISITEHRMMEHLYTFKYFEIIKGNGIHILWQIPQYICMTFGEVLFAVNGLEFAVIQSPHLLKSVMQTCWFVTIAMGNIIVIIEAYFHPLKSMAHQMYLFSVIMILDILLFMWLARRYCNNSKREFTQNLIHQPNSSMISSDSHGIMSRSDENATVRKVPKSVRIHSIQLPTISM